MQDFGVKYEHFYNSSYETNQTSAPVKNMLYNYEEDIGMTYYDLQSHGSMQNRIHVFDDGTIGAVFTFRNYPIDYQQGTGYNYFDGENWDPFPTEKLEEHYSGWPAYAPFGENGEIIVSHIASYAVEEGLTFLKREYKGLGEWEQWIFEGPAGYEDIYFPRIATGGVNYSVIYLLAITHPGLSIYQGQDAALLYSKSEDGGVNWNPENTVIPEINANHYVGFGPDLYDIRAEGDNVAILIGGPWIDFLLLKSTDGGENWEQTIIWENPYPFFEYWNSTPTDTFYCVDGSHNMDFDNEGMVHVVFGINRAYADYDGTYWFPAVGGIGYWNESRPAFSYDMNALNPYGHPDSELEEDYSLVGWSQDVNGNGQLDILDYWGTYYLGFSSMPQIFCDNLNKLVLVYSSVTETYDNDAQNYRHLWIRGSMENGLYWGQHIDLTSHPSHQFDECVFPSLAEYSDEWETYYLVYQSDYEPGMALRGDYDPYGENFIRYMKTDFGVGIYEDKYSSNYLEVSQNQPNPFTDKTTIHVKLSEPGILKLKVTNLTGKSVYENKMGYRNTGTHNISLEVPLLSPGVYFYSVVAGDHSVTKKMIIK